jgi:hypothetical protein
LVPKFLRSRKNRPCLHALLFVVLASWLVLLVSATCTMPLPWQAAPEAMPACPEPHAPAKSPLPKTDCSLKTCLEAPSAPGLAAHPDRPPQLPLAILCLIWLAATWLRPDQTSRSPRWLEDPPPGRRIPLIYRFCTLLN